MQVIQSILNTQAKVSTKVLATDGLCVWICWSKGFEPKVAAMLEESGGLEIANTSSQSLWFFFNVEVTLYALAKIDIWGKQFSTGVTVFTFPGKLVVGPDRVLTVEIESEFTNMTTGNPQSIVYIFTHPALWPYATSLPGISFYDMTILEKQGLFGWKMITADRRLPFSAEHGWFAFLHPVGNPLDKNYQKGWGKIFTNIEPLLESAKLKYSLQSGFLSVSISTVQQLRSWVEQILIIFDDIHEHHQDIYWPCLSIIMDRNNFNFTPDLYEKLDIDWDSLSPNRPYLNYKNAFLLGKQFSIHDRHYSSQPTDLEVLCTVTLKALDSSLPIPNPLIAKVLATSHISCFYCGSSGHPAESCPTKQLKLVYPDFWKNLNYLDFGEINASYRTIDAEVNGKGMDAFTSMLAEDDAVSRLLRATFAINASCQLPNVSRIWQITTRDMEEIPDKPNAQKEPAWAILKRLTQPAQDLNAIDRDCMNQIGKNPKNWHLHCLYGFISMERGDFAKSISAWRDAESICTTTAHQAWIKFLIARLKEVQGFHSEAFELYKYAKKLLPNWKDLDYRIHVCQVKMGFGQGVSKIFAAQIEENPEFFHKFIIDPELARGHTQILVHILPVWRNAHNLFTVDRIALEELLQTLTEWFEETDNPMIYYGAKIRKLLGFGDIKNYLLFLEFAEFKPKFETDLIRIINQEISALKQDYEKCLSQVEIIRDEMNWFYFQRALADFNSTFNECARILNWAFVSNFNDVAIYKEAREQLPELQEYVAKLKGKLNRLRMVRDVTLFFLLMLRTFFITASILVSLSVILVFVVLFYGVELGLPAWTQGIIKSNFWELMRIVLSITLMLSLGLASLKTTVLFDKKRNKLLQAAKDERIKSQQWRIDKAKKQRSDEEKQAKKLAEKHSALPF